MPCECLFQYVILNQCHAFAELKMIVATTGFSLLLSTLKR